jgi:AcrR family transcriptional regulator
MSMNNRNAPVDLRVRRTQKLLWEALMALLAEQAFESISVKDICDLAMVHRTTFYKHYEDKYHLLRKGMREVYEALAVEADVLPDAFLADDAPPVFVGFFEHVEKHQRFYSLMLCGDGMSKFQGLLRTYLAELCEIRLYKAATDLPTTAVPIPLLAQFCAGTVISTTTWWLENALPYPPRQMACYVKRLLRDGCVLA